MALILSPLAGLCMGPHVSRNLLTQLYHLPDMLLRMPGDEDPEGGEKLQVGGDSPWLGLVEPEHGSRVFGPLFVNLLIQEVTVKEGSIWCLELSKLCVEKEDS